MNFLQIITSVLFYYVFGLGAILLTWYTVKSIKLFFQEEHRGRTKRLEHPPPDMQQENVKLHISEGLIQVNRLPQEEQDTAP